MKKGIILLLLITSSSAWASMPGWIHFTDADKNRYYVAPHGRIYTSEKPDFVYKPVSKEGMFYYLSQGEALIKKYNPYEGLLILKSIRLLSSLDPSLHYAGVKATSLINRMRLDQGTRFDRYNERASLLLCRIEDRVHVYSEHFGTRFSWEGSVSVIKRMTHKTHLYRTDSVMYGLRLPDADDNGKGYDALMTVSSEVYTYGEVRTVERYMNMRKIKKRRDSYERSAVKNTSDTEINEIEFSYASSSVIDPAQEEVFKPLEKEVIKRAEGRCRGVEGIYAFRQGGTVIQIVVPDDRFPLLEDGMMELLNSMEFDNNLKPAYSVSP